MYRIIGSDQKEYGPISADKVRQWLAQGRVHRQTQIKPEGATDWQPLSALPEFAGDLAAATVPPPVEPPSKSPTKTSSMAITSLVLGILGLFSCGITAIVGLVVGIVALVKINKSEGRMSGRGLAIGGIAVSAVMVLVLPILAGMLLPALASAKQKVQRVGCVNNVKQLALAVRTYAADNNEQYPPPEKWCDLLEPYAGSPRVFQCPAAPNLRCGYGFNQKLAGKKESEIDPQTVVIFECDAGWNATGGPEMINKSSRHAKMFCVGFADGHVEQRSRVRLAELRWDP